MRLNNLQKWVNGISEHNHEDHECVPDFSCCIPELQASKEVREDFLKVALEDDHETVGQYLYTFNKAKSELFGDDYIDKEFEKGRH